VQNTVWASATVLSFTGLTIVPAPIDLCKQVNILYVFSEAR